MSRKNLNWRPPSPLPHSVLLRMAHGETIHVGNDVCVRLMNSSQGHAHLSISAPRSVRIDREKNFIPAQKNDGPSAPTLEPSAK